MLSHFGGWEAPSIPLMNYLSWVCQHLLKKEEKACKTEMDNMISVSTIVPDFTHRMAKTSLLLGKRHRVIMNIAIKTRNPTQPKLTCHGLRHSSIQRLGTFSARVIGRLSSIQRL